MSYPKIPSRVVSLMMGALLAACGGSASLPSQATIDSAAVRQRSGSACTWSTVTTPNGGTAFGDQNILQAVAARNSSDAWAVGSFRNFSASLTHTLAEHWNGTRWKLSSSLDGGGQTNVLYGVAVTGTRDAWAVGYSRTYTGSQTYRTLIEHWNGRKWSTAQSNSQIGILNGVAAVSPKDVWAVGTQNFPGSGVIEHWNGKQWSYTQLGTAIEFRSVAVIARSDIWAVGEKTVGSAFDATLTYHFDGTRWRHVKSPSPLHVHYSDQNWLTAVVPIASNDVWALGIMRNGDYGVLDQPLSLHWNGKRWKLVKFPAPGGSGVYNSIWGGAAPAANDLWAVGDVGLNSTQTLAVQWNGTGWSQAPTPPGSDATLWAATPDRTGGAWAVGDTSLTSQSALGTLALRCR